jgi:hypothetical protein
LAGATLKNHKWESLLSNYLNVIRSNTRRF